MAKLVGRQLGTLLILVFCASWAGCAQKTINDVLADPQRYSDRDVRISGDVIESFSVTGRGFYRVEDGTGRLWVFSTKGVPRKGARVSVKGKIQDGFDISSLGGVINLPEPIQERIESGLLMIESSHKAQN